MFSPVLENKVEAQEEAAAGYIRTIKRRNSSLPENGILVVERKTCAAGNERIVAIAEGQNIYVAEITRPDLAAPAATCAPVHND